MAHVGEELRLRTTRGLGCLLRRNQLDGSRLHLLLEVITVQREFAVAHFDLVQHFVEAVDQATDFVVAMPFDAHRIVVVARDRLGGARQALDGIGDDSPHPPSDQQDQRERADQRQGEPGHAARHVAPGRGQIGFYLDCAKPLAAQHDRAFDAQRRLEQADPGAALRRRRRANARAIGCKNLAVLVDDTCSRRVRLGTQCREHLRRRIPVIEGNRAGAVGAEHVGQRLELLALVVLLFDQLVDGKNNERQQESRAERERHDEPELVAQRQPAEASGKQFHFEAPSGTLRPIW